MSGDPAPLGDGLERVLRSLGAPGVAAVTTVFGAWPEVVGPAAAAHSRPVALHDGALTVAVDEPGWATQLRFQEATVLRRLAELGGSLEPAERLEIRVQPPWRDA